MSTTFSRSMRSLKADSPQAGVLGLLIIVGLLSLWLAWSLLARITVYEVTEQAQLVSQSTVVAQFSAAALGRLHPGQPAQLQLESYPWLQYGTVPAVVTRVPRKHHPDGWLEVRLAIQDGSAPQISLQHGLTGAIKVEVEQVSPVTLLLRAVGQNSRTGSNHDQ